VQQASFALEMEELTEGPETDLAASRPILLAIFAAIRNS
jgi:hypothetical protein